jgi:murein DD-endopeptidase MepM/ murein hydrolase activator NlpD
LLDNKLKFTQWHFFGSVFFVFYKGFQQNKNGSYTARLCGLAENTMVHKGDRVKQNQPIGTVGEIPLELSADSHIHLEIIKDGAYKRVATKAYFAKHKYLSLIPNLRAIFTT